MPVAVEKPATSSVRHVRTVSERRGTVRSVLFIGSPLFITVSTGVPARSDLVMMGAFFSKFVFEPLFVSWDTMIALIGSPAPDGRTGFGSRREYHALVGAFIALGPSATYPSQSRAATNAVSTKLRLISFESH